MKISYKPKGVCSRLITLELEGDVVRDVKFVGGCSGNAQGISRLAEGRPAPEVIGALSGIRCGFKNTSCPDQLSIALRRALEKA